MLNVSGVVKGVYSKPVTTKFGQKNVWDLLLDDGNYYKHGFKKPSVEVGDSVTITYEVGKYGDEIKSLSGATVGASSPTPVEVSGPVNKVTSYPIKNSKPFPVPFDSGERAIIRQNSLTNARELVVGIIQHDTPNKEESSWTSRQSQYETLANEILRIAYIFEEYSSGDREAKAVDAIFDKNKATKAKKTKPEPGEDAVAF